MMLNGADVRTVIDELYGFGPIQPLLDDPSVTEVMVNLADRVYVERNGKPARTTIIFDDEAHVQASSTASCVRWARQLDGNNPLVDAPSRWVARERGDPAGGDRRAVHHDPEIQPQTPGDAGPGQIRLADAVGGSEFLKSCVQRG